MSVITCGIYAIYINYKFTEDINKICEGDGNESPNYIIVVLLGMCTCGIYTFYWWYKQAERLKRVSLKYNVFIRERGVTILCWQILGAWLFGIGPVIATYIMFDNMNRLALVYNGEKTSEEVNEMGPAHPNLLRNIIIIAVSSICFIIICFFIGIGASSEKEQSSSSIKKVKKSGNNELLELDLEVLIDASEEKVEQLGFEQNDFGAYDAFDGAIEVSLTDEKVDSIVIDDNGEDLPSLCGVKIGMEEEEVRSILKEEYSDVEERDNETIFFDLENQRSIFCDIQNGRVKTLMYRGLPKSFVEEYQHEKEEEKETNEKKEVAEEESVLTDPVAIGWAGAYRDDDSGNRLVIAAVGYEYSYVMYSSSGQVFQSETGCSSLGDYLEGKYYTFYKNENGLLGVTSGAGGGWGNYRRISGTNSPDLELEGTYGDDETQITVSEQMAKANNVPIGADIASAYVEYNRGLVIEARLYTQGDGGLAIVDSVTKQVYGIATFKAGRVEITGSGFDGVYESY